MQETHLTLQEQLDQETHLTLQEQLDQLAVLHEAMSWGLEDGPRQKFSQQDSLETRHICHGSDAEESLIQWANR